MKVSDLCGSVARHLEGGHGDGFLNLKNQLNVVGSAGEDRVDPTAQQGDRQVHLQHQHRSQHRTPPGLGIDRQVHLQHQDRSQDRTPPGLGTERQGRDSKQSCNEDM